MIILFCYYFINCGYIGLIGWINWVCGWIGGWDGFNVYIILSIIDFYDIFYVCLSYVIDNVAAVYFLSSYMILP